MKQLHIIPAELNNLHYQGSDTFFYNHNQRWSNRTRVLVLVLEDEYFLSTRTRVRSKVIVLVLEYITKVIVLTITFNDYIFFI